MNKYDVKLCRLIGKREIAPGILDFLVEAPEFANKAVIGQFAHIRLPGRTLRRPISICYSDRSAGNLRFVFQIRGEGTAELAAIRPGDMLDILAPLGKGFPAAGKDKKALLIGGGIGVPPLLGLAEYFGRNAVAALGFRNRGAVILTEDFQRLGAKVMVATEDGSVGYHGFVTTMIEREYFEVVYACGPAPMLKSVTSICKQRQVPCYISLEERMACGVGACLGCAIKLVDAQGVTRYGHVCKDGPVFDYRYVSEFR